MSQDFIAVQLCCPTSSPSEVCGIQCANTFPWDLVICIYKVILNHSLDKLARLHSLSGYLLGRGTEIQPEKGSVGK